jgi:parallel beta-helix repeat protein
MVEKNKCVVNIDWQVLPDMETARGYDSRGRMVKPPKTLVSEPVFRYICCEYRSCCSLLADIENDIRRMISGPNFLFRRSAMKRLCMLTVTIIAGLCLPVSGTIIHVPDDYPTIQEGIYATEHGDTVLVHPGTYYENVVSDASNIVIGSLFLTTGDTSYISSTIIDGDAAGPVFSSHYDIIGPPIFAGFTVQNGSAYSGGGIYCNTTAIEIHSNIIKDNSCEYNGGGIFCDEFWGIIHDNVIVDNHAGYRGGGAYFIGSEPIFSNNRVFNNTSTGDGGGVYCWQFYGDMSGSIISGNHTSGNGGGIFLRNSSSFLIERCVVADNSCQENGGGIAIYSSLSSLFNVTVTRNQGGIGGGLFCDQPTTLYIVNSIFWGDTASVEGNEIKLEGNAFNVNYSDIQGGFPGNGNIDEDPLFVDPQNGVYYLQDGSPCIDAGDPDWPRDPDGTIVDMGAFYYGIVIPEIIDQEQTVADPGFWFDEAEVRWQQFFPTLNNITAVALFIVKAGSPGNVIIQLTTDSGEILNESSVYQSHVPDSDWVRIVLPETIDLEPGEPYRIYVFSSEPSPGPDERYTWNGNHDSDYPGITDVYDIEPDYDYAFMTYGYDRETGTENIDVAFLPKEFRLFQNYPNPFNASTTIKYNLPSASHVIIEIYDILGRRVESLVQGEQQAGYHQVVWDASELSSGLYFYTIKAGDYVETRKTLLLK